MIPIFVPAPADERSGPQSCVAPISVGVRSSVGRKVRFGQTRATPGTRARSATRLRGTTTDMPSTTTPYRHRAAAPGIRRRIRIASDVCAPSRRRRYATLGAARTSSRLPTPFAASDRHGASASGGAAIVTTTSTRRTSGIALRAGAAAGTTMTTSAAASVRPRFRPGMVRARCIASTRGGRRAVPCGPGARP